MKNLIYRNVGTVIWVFFLLFLTGCNSDELLNENADFVQHNDACTELITQGESYFWYRGNKIELVPVSSKRYVLFESNSSIKLAKTSEMQAVKVGVKDKLVQNNYVWTILNAKEKSNIDDDVVYSSPFYLTPEGEEVGVSHLFYVKLKSKQDFAILDSLSTKYNVHIEGQNEYLPLWYTLSCDKYSYADALKTAALFYETGLFEASEPSFIVQGLLNESDIMPYAVSINDPYYSQQWNLKGNNSINWPNAYEISKGSGVRVGIFDQGIDILNPDLDSSRILCFDTVSKDLDVPIVVYGNHGTAVAGIIYATANNGKGISGIAPMVSILSIANPFTGSPDMIQQLANGFSVASNSCDVINCSWSGDALRSTLIDDAIEYYCQLWGRNGKGTVIVFATGNDSKGSVNYPGSSNDYLIRVGWSTKSGTRYTASNYGDKLDIMAPGNDIVTTDRPGSLGYVSGDYYTKFNGTSAAAPHVAGVAALMLSINPNLTATEVKEILAKTARKVGGYSYIKYSDKPYGTWNKEMGYGLVDAEAAVKAAKQKL